MINGAARMMIMISMMFRTSVKGIAPRTNFLLLYLSSATTLATEFGRENWDIVMKRENVGLTSI